MSTYTSHFFSGSLDPTWPHILLIGGSLLGGALVGLGVILEAHKFWSLPTLSVFAGIVIEAICTLLLFGFDEGISSKQQSTIDLQQKKIIELDTKIAENQQVLLWQQMPRMLSNVTKCREVLRASRNGATVRILWRSDVSDGEGFAFFISTCFADPEHPWPPKWNVERGQAVEKMPTGAEKTGVTIISNRFGNWLNAPQAAGEFVAKGIYEGVFLHMGVSVGYDPSLPDDVVVIAIGPKLP